MEHEELVAKARKYDADLEARFQRIEKVLEELTVIVRGIVDNMKE